MEIWNVICSWDVFTKLSLDWDSAFILSGSVRNLWNLWAFSKTLSLLWVYLWDTLCELLKGRLHFNHLLVKAIPNVFWQVSVRDSWTCCSGDWNWAFSTQHFKHVTFGSTVYNPASLCRHGQEVVRVVLNKTSRKEKGKRKARVKVDAQDW